jgi:hypothetical protein
MIGFAAPWVLAALALLPAIWWLLRVTPPAPRIVRFPAIRLLRGLTPREETPARTPLWLILMRLLLAALIIVALAGPILRPAAAPPGRGPEIIVIDTGWAAAESWPSIRDALLAEIDRDERAGMAVALIATARSAAGGPLAPVGPVTATEARRAAETMEPSPWPADRAEAAALLQRFDGRSSLLWLSDGVAGAGDAALTRAAAAFTAARVRVPERSALPRLLLPPDAGPDLALTVRRAPGGNPTPATLIARAEDGRLLGEASATFEGDAADATIRFDLPAELRNQIARIDVASAHGAGGAVLLDERWRRRPVAIAAPSAGTESSSLLSGAFYLTRALQPFAEVRTGDIPTLLQGEPAVLILTDATPVAPGERRAIADWVAKGGLLLRFAGARLAAEEPGGDALLPTELRTGGRSLSGAMSWTKPASLAPFPETSPLAGLEIPADATVSRQILAEPSVDLDSKVWARLADGTPLITADKRGAGALVLVHTSADPSWSNLALSGLFPQILRRIVAYSAGVSRTPQHGVLEPYRVLDGFARLRAPGGPTTGIGAEGFDASTPDAQHPPGYYGEADSRRALNLTETVTRIAAIDSFPGLTREAYGAPGETSLSPILLGVALALAAADTIVALWLGGALPRLPGRRKRAAAAVIALAFAIAGAGPAGAEQTVGASDARAAEAAAQVTLGYVATGDSATDRISKAGLDGLVRQLILRTSIDHAAPAAVDLETDELSLYPLLYWPIAASTAPLSDRAKEKLNRYLATGGMVLIDTRAGAGGGQPNLSRLIQGIDVPTLTPIPPGHVLTKSFYLLDQFPGRTPGGDLWVERDQDAHNDGVSSIVVGSADWAGAWAVDANGAPLFSIAPGGEQQREWAYRFGVNLVMYALTGNYKADLVHAPFIQQRLGQ